MPSTGSTSRKIRLDGGHGPHVVVPPCVPDNDAPDLGRLQQRLQQIVAGCSVKQEAIHELLVVARQLTNAVDVAYSLRSEGERVSLIAQRAAPLFGTEESQQLLSRQANRVSETGEVALQRQQDGMHIVTVPVFATGQPCESIHAGLMMRQSRVEPFIISLQLVASAMGQWYAANHSLQDSQTATVAAAAIELLSKCGRAGSLSESCLVVVNEMQKFVGCETVALATCTRSNNTPRIVAVSGSHRVDQRTAPIKELTSIAHETLDRGELTVWPPLSSADRHASLVHRQLVDSDRYSAVLSCPLESDGHVVGAWIFLGDRRTLHDPQVVNAVLAASPHVANVLLLQDKANAGPLRRTRKLVRGTPESRRRRTAVLLALLLIAAAMAIPLPYKVSCDCRVEPTIRRFAVVPYDGSLQESFVQPGDVVTKDEVVARMDDRDMRFERSEVTAERTKSLKERDVRLAAREVAAAQIADLKAKELQVKLDWIGYREENLDIKSPVSGVVLSGDLEDAEGAPVQTGQMLFEIAPLDALELQIDIPEKDITYVAEQMMVTARLDGAPGEEINGKLVMIAPRATAETGCNIFRGDVSFELEKQMELRPGMRGTARVVSADRPLGWILFHRAYQRVVDNLEW